MIIGNKTIEGHLVSKLTKGSERKVRLRCDECGLESTTAYANYYMSQQRRKWVGTTYCRKCACVVNGIKRRGSSAWNKGIKLPESKKGVNHSSWKGGRYIDAHGYIMLHVGQKAGDSSKWDSYRKEHVLVMEHCLGRTIRKGEVIHHIDGAKLNNALSNLFLTTHKGHRESHNSLQELGYLLVRGGLVTFDNGQYMAHNKLRELLGHPEEGNQQPSLDGDVLEGSTTRRESPEDNNSPTSAGHEQTTRDDIV